MSRGRPYEPGDVINVPAWQLVKVRESDEYLTGPLTGLVISTQTFDDPTTGWPFTVVWVMWSRPFRIEQHAVRGLPSPLR